MLRLVPPESGHRFPSDEHHEELKKKGFNGRTSDVDLFHWHSYDFGWRRVALQRRDDNSPIDPERKWFDADLVARAEEYWARKYNRSVGPAESKPAVESRRMLIAAAYRWAYARGEPMPPGLPDSDPRVDRLVRRFEDARESQFAAQDRERAVAKARIIGDGKNPDGSHSAEAIAYVELCGRQIRANLRELYERSQWMQRMPDGSTVGEQADERADELARIREELGVSSREHDDDDVDI